LRRLSSWTFTDDVLEITMPALPTSMERRIESVKARRGYAVAPLRRWRVRAAFCAA